MTGVARTIDDFKRCIGMFHLIVCIWAVIFPCFAERLTSCDVKVNRDALAAHTIIYRNTKPNGNVHAHVPSHRVAFV
jgi:hypothetical protein